jgi:hypothetical protein
MCLGFVEKDIIYRTIFAEKPCPEDKTTIICRVRAFLLQCDRCWSQSVNEDQHVRVYIFFLCTWIGQVGRISAMDSFENSLIWKSRSNRYRMTFSNFVILNFRKKIISTMYRYFYQKSLTREHSYTQYYQIVPLLHRMSYLKKFIWNGSFQLFTLFYCVWCLFK